ncbi:MAG: hypothetical protein AAGD25_25100 [Cyanobacteria bacterium P01_F01_bin.150]
MSQSPTHTNADSAPAVLNANAEDIDALGPAHRQRITPLGQSFLSPKKLAPVSHSHMAVLHLARQQRSPFGVIQDWPDISTGAFDRSEQPLGIGTEMVQRWPDDQQEITTNPSPIHNSGQEQSTSVPAPPNPITPPHSHLPGVMRRSSALKRQVKQTKTKILRSLQAQFPRSKVTEPTLSSSPNSPNPNSPNPQLKAEEPTPNPSQEGDRSGPTLQLPSQNLKSKIQNSSNSPNPQLKTEEPTPNPSQEGDRSGPTLQLPSQNLKSKIQNSSNSPNPQLKAEEPTPNPTQEGDRSGPTPQLPSQNPAFDKLRHQSKIQNSSNSTTPQLHNSTTLPTAQRDTAHIDSPQHISRMPYLRAVNPKPEVAVEGAVEGTRSLTNSAPSPDVQRLTTANASKFQPTADSTVEPLVQRLASDNPSQIQSNIQPVQAESRPQVDVQRLANSDVSQAEASIPSVSAKPTFASEVQRLARDNPLPTPSSVQLTQDESSSQTNIQRLANSGASQASTSTPSVPPQATLASKVQRLDNKGQMPSSNHPNQSKPISKSDVQRLAEEDTSRSVSPSIQRTPTEAQETTVGSDLGSTVQRSPHNMAAAGSEPVLEVGKQSVSSVDADISAQPGIQRSTNESGSLQPTNAESSSEPTVQRLEASVNTDTSWESAVQRSVTAATSEINLDSTVQQLTSDVAVAESKPASAPMIQPSASIKTDANLGPEVQRLDNPSQIPSPVLPLQPKLMPQADVQRITNDDISQAASSSPSTSSKATFAPKVQRLDNGVQAPLGSHSAQSEAMAEPISMPEVQRSLHNVPTVEAEPVLTTDGQSAASGNADINVPSGIQRSTHENGEIQTNNSAANSTSTVQQLSPSVNSGTNSTSTVQRLRSSANSETHFESTAQSLEASTNSETNLASTVQRSEASTNSETNLASAVQRSETSISSEVNLKSTVQRSEASTNSEVNLKSTAQRSPEISVSEPEPVFAPTIQQSSSIELGTNLEPKVQRLDSDNPSQEPSNVQPIQAKSSPQMNVQRLANSDTSQTSASIPSVPPQATLASKVQRLDNKEQTPSISHPNQAKPISTPEVQRLEGEDTSHSTSSSIQQGATEPQGATVDTHLNSTIQRLAKEDTSYSTSTDLRQIPIEPQGATVESYLSSAVQRSPHHAPTIESESVLSAGEQSDSSIEVDVNVQPGIQRSANEDGVRSPATPQTANSESIPESRVQRLEDSTNPMAPSDSIAQRAEDFAPSEISLGPTVQRSTHDTSVTQSESVSTPMISSSPSVETETDIKQGVQRLVSDNSSQTPSNVQPIQAKSSQTNVQQPANVDTSQASTSTPSVTSLPSIQQTPTETHGMAVDTHWDSKVQRSPHHALTIESESLLAAGEQSIPSVDADINMPPGIQRSANLEPEVQQLKPAINSKAHPESTVQRLENSTNSDTNLESKVQRLEESAKPDPKVESTMHRPEAAATAATNLDATIQRLEKSTNPDTSLESMANRSEVSATSNTATTNLESRVQRFEASANSDTNVESTAHQPEVSATSATNLESTVQRLEDSAHSGTSLDSTVQRLEYSATFATNLDSTVQRLEDSAKPDTNTESAVQRLEDSATAATSLASTVQRLEDPARHDTRVESAVQRLEGSGTSGTHLESTVQRLESSVISDTNLDSTGQHPKAIANPDTTVEPLVQRLMPDVSGPEAEPALAPIIQPSSSIKIDADLGPVAQRLDNGNPLQTLSNNQPVQAKSMPQADVQQMPDSDTSQTSSNILSASSKLTSVSKVQRLDNGTQAPSSSHSAQSKPMVEPTVKPDVQRLAEEDTARLTSPSIQQASTESQGTIVDTYLNSGVQRSPHSIPTIESKSVVDVGKPSTTSVDADINRQPAIQRSANEDGGIQSANPASNLELEVPKLGDSADAATNLAPKVQRLEASANSEPNLESTVQRLEATTTTSEISETILETTKQQLSPTANFGPNLEATVQRLEDSATNSEPNPELTVQRLEDSTTSATSEPNLESTGQQLSPTAHSEPNLESTVQRLEAPANSDTSVESTVQRLTPDVSVPESKPVLAPIIQPSSSTEPNADLAPEVQRLDNSNPLQTLSNIQPIQAKSMPQVDRPQMPNNSSQAGHSISSTNAEPLLESKVQRLDNGTQASSSSHSAQSEPVAESIATPDVQRLAGEDTVHLSSSIQQTSTETQGPAVGTQLDSADTHLDSRVQRSPHNIPSSKPEITLTAGELSTTSVDSDVNTQPEIQRSANEDGGVQSANHASNPESKVQRLEPSADTETNLALKVQRLESSASSESSSASMVHQLESSANTEANLESTVQRLESSTNSDTNFKATVQRLMDVPVLQSEPASAPIIQPSSASETGADLEPEVQRLDNGAQASSSRYSVQAELISQPAVQRSPFNKPDTKAVLETPYSADKITPEPEQSKNIQQLENAAPASNAETIQPAQDHPVSTPKPVQTQSLQRQDDNQPHHNPPQNPPAIPPYSADPKTIQLLDQNALPNHPSRIASDMRVTQPMAAMKVVQPTAKAPELPPPPLEDDPTMESEPRPNPNHQPQDEDQGQQLDLRAAHYLPQGVISGVNGPTTAAMMGATDEAKTTMQNALHSTAKVKATFESRKGKSVGKITPAELATFSDKVIPPAQQVQEEQVIQPEEDTSEEDVDEQAVELLAREVYQLLRQRLSVERERFGGYYRDRVGR